MQSLVIVAAGLLAVAGPARSAPPPAAGAAPWGAWAAYSAGAGKPGRSLVGLGDDAPAPAAGPMSPFLKLKPFLPAKPAFGPPPAVDPSKFIDMKADLLSGLFPGGLPVGMAGMAPVGGAAPAGFLSARALLSPFAAPAAAIPKPPPPAFLADLFKALSINKTVANASDTDSVPAFPAAAPIVDPGVFISKKAKFLSDLFASLPTTTTPAPAPASDPAALNAELAASLQRVLAALSTPAAPGPQDGPEDEAELAFAAKEKRAADPATATLGALGDAKDKVVDTIISELAEIKNGMVGAVSDLALAQKAADAAAAAAAAAPKKPLPPYAAMWAKPTATKAPTTVPVEPVHQKVVLLGQVFDMLTGMEKDIASSMVVPVTGSPDAAEGTTASPDILDVVKAKISQLVGQTNSSGDFPAPVNRTSALTSTKTLRLAGVAPKASAAAADPVDPSFWIPDAAVVGPDAYLAKTKAFLATIMTAKSTPSPIVRRSFKPLDFQQGGDQQSQASSALQDMYRKQFEAAGQQQKSDQQHFPGFPFEVQHHQHQHHHDRQPHWWN